MGRGREIERDAMSPLVAVGLAGQLHTFYGSVQNVWRRRFGSYPVFVISVDSPVKGNLGELSVLAREEPGREGGRVIGGHCSLIPFFLPKSLWAAEQRSDSQSGSPEQQPAWR